MLYSFKILQLFWEVYTCISYLEQLCRKFKRTELVLRNLLLKHSEMERLLNKSKPNKGCKSGKRQGGNAFSIKNKENFHKKLTITIYKCSA